MDRTFPDHTAGKLASSMRATRTMLRPTTVSNVRMVVVAAWAAAVAWAVVMA
jgi:hypothetical protein